MNRKDYGISTRLGLCALGVALALILGACQSTEDTGSYVLDSKADGLPNVKLIDQNGHEVSLPSLKGKPVLIDFIYTTCNGPCPMLTNKFALIANLMPYDSDTTSRWFR